MRYLSIVLFVVTVAGNCVAQEAIVATKLLPAIRDVQLANLDEINRLSIEKTLIAAPVRSFTKRP